MTRVPIRKVLVTDAHRASALAVIRSLGKMGCVVIAADCERLPAGGYSRYVAQRLTYPSPMTEPGACADALIDAARKLEIDLIIPVTDEVIIPLDRRRHLVPSSCQLAIAPSEALQVAWDKSQTLELANRLGIRCPQGSLVHEPEEAIAVAEQIGWPVVFKPIASRCASDHGIESRRIQYADSPASLRRCFSSVGSGEPVLIQETIRGVGCGVEVLARQGQVLAAFQHRRMREVPITGGVSSLRRSEPLDREMLAATKKLMAALKWTGLAMVEFKRTAEHPVLMEINGRIWGSLPLACRAGMDFPARLVKMHEGHDTQCSAASYRVGVLCRNLPLDLAWSWKSLIHRPGPLGRTVSKWSAIRPWIDIVRPTIGWDAWSLSDPRPGWMSTLVTIRKIASRPFAPMRRKSS